MAKNKMETSSNNNSEHATDDQTVEETHEDQEVVETQEQIEDEHEDSTVTDSTEETDDDQEDDGIDTDAPEFKDAVQKQVSKIVAERLGREKRKVSSLEAELEQLKESLAEKETAYDELTQTSEKALYENMVWSVVESTGVSYKVVSSLKGDTVEELTEAAKLVQENAPKQGEGFNRLFKPKPKEQADDLSSVIETLSHRR